MFFLRLFKIYIFSIIHFILKIIIIIIANLIYFSKVFNYLLLKLFFANLLAFIENNIFKL